MAGTEIILRSTVRNLSGSEYAEISAKEDHWFVSAFEQYSHDLQLRYEDSLRDGLETDPFDTPRIPTKLAAVLLEMELSRTFIEQYGYVNFNDFCIDAIGGHYNYQHFIWAKTSFVEGIGLETQTLSK
jgi:hypothetical protein